MKNIDLKNTLKKLIYSLSLIYFVSSCNNSSVNNVSNESTSSSILDNGFSKDHLNGYKYFYNDFQEILDEFTNTLNQEYLISQSNNESEYQREETVNGITKRVKLKIMKNYPQSIPNNENVISNMYMGEMSVNGEKNEYDMLDHYGSYYVYFYIPNGVEITLQNILEHNKYEFDDGFIRGIERFSSGSRGGSVESFFGTDKKVINGSGKLLKLEGLHQNGNYYMSGFLKDTIEYSVLIKNERRNGRYFKKNIVSTKRNYNDNKMNNPEMFDGEFIKYIEYEGEFVDNKEVGLHIKRRNGVVDSEILYDDPGYWIIQKEYFNGKYDDLYFKSEDELVIKKDHGESIKHVWSNQDKLDIEVDGKGYKSYTPSFLTSIKHRKGITIEGSNDKIYVHHGPYEEYRFFPIKPMSDFGNIKPTILSNYLNGFLDGNIIKNSEAYGLEEFNGTFENGQFIEGVFKEYTSDFDSGVYLQKEYIINENGLKWKEYNTSGEIIDEGFSKTSPNEYFYGERNGYGLDFDWKRHEILKKS